MQLVISILTNAATFLVDVALGSAANATALSVVERNSVTAQLGD